MHRVLQPGGWPQPRGYANGISATGRIIFVAGQIGWDAGGRFRSDTLAGQARQALENIRSVLAEDGALPQHIVRLTWFVTSRQEYLDQQREIGVAYRDIMARHFPVMSVVQVAALIESEARVEIEATAVVPMVSVPAGS
jgi:enamine deaminase RidA (YjgF/YER057c/UK114 family)